MKKKMSNGELLEWSQDHDRTALQLKEACEGLRLSNIGNSVTRRRRLRKYLSDLPQEAPADWYPSTSVPAFVAETVYVDPAPGPYPATSEPAVAFAPKVHKRRKKGHTDPPSGYHEERRNRFGRGTQKVLVRDPKPAKKETIVSGRDRAITPILGGLIAIAAIIAVAFILYQWAPWDDDPDHTSVVVIPSSSQTVEDLRSSVLTDIDAKLKTAQGDAKSVLEKMRNDAKTTDAETLKLYAAALKKYDQSLALANTSNSTTGSGNSSSGSSNTTRNGQQSTGATGQSTQTSCGSIEWGPAGKAPGASTSDSAKQVTEAAQVMNVALDSIQYLTVHKFCPGDDTPNGWILGSSMTEANGIRVTAGFLPAGTCVDYDPGATKLSGNIDHTQVLNPKWSRSLLKSDGSATGLKMTVYWTPCVFTDGFKTVAGTAGAQTTSVKTSSTCPASPDQAATKYGGSASNWKQHPQYPNGWIYVGPVIQGFTVPDGGKVDYDGGSKESDTVPSGSAFTAWCPK